MVRCLELLQIVLIAVSTIKCDITIDSRAKRKNEYGDKSLWKKEYEEELSDAMLTGKKQKNITRVAQAASGVSDNEGVIERLMDSITSSEKYLKKVDSIDFRVNRLDIEIHEKTNNIMKLLTEIKKILHNDGHPDKSESLLENLKNEIYQIKFMLEHNPRTTNGNNRQ